MIEAFDLSVQKSSRCVVDTATSVKVLFNHLASSAGFTEIAGTKIQAHQESLRQKEAFKIYRLLTLKEVQSIDKLLSCITLILQCKLPLLLNNGGSSINRRQIRLHGRNLTPKITNDSRFVTRFTRVYWNIRRNWRHLQTSPKNRSPTHTHQHIRQTQKQETPKGAKARKFIIQAKGEPVAIIQYKASKGQIVLNIIITTR